MQKDVNYALLIVILGLLLGIVGISIYYQNTYRWLSDEYDAAQKQLEDRINELTAKQKSLNQTEALLNKTDKDLSDLRNKYTGLESEKDALARDLMKTRLELDSLNQTVASYRTRRAALVNDIASLRYSVNDLKNKIDAMENETLRASLVDYMNQVVERMSNVEQDMTLMQTLP